MIDFRTLIDPSCVAVDVEVDTRDELLVLMSRMLANASLVPDADALFADLLAREALVSTGIGEGIAMPHALTSSAPRSVMALCRLKHPVDFFALDGVPVTIVILSAGPRDSTGMHLQILAKIARLFHDSAFRSAFEDAPTAEALTKLFHNA